MAREFEPGLWVTSVTGAVRRVPWRSGVVIGEAGHYRLFEWLVGHTWVARKLAIDIERVFVL